MGGPIKQNLILISAIIVTVLLGVNSFKRILSFQGTSQKIVESQERLDKVKKENEKLKQELEYKKSPEFEESEIRNKLGLAKEGETIVVIPKEESDKPSFAEASEGKPNWQKWQSLLLGED